jgi:uncharacterized membrane protein
MDTLIWLLSGFTVGSLIFSFLLRKEKIKIVIIVLTAIWVLAFFVKFAMYLNSVTPPPPPELTVLGGVVSFLGITILVSEFFKKRD